MFIPMAPGVGVTGGRTAAPANGWVKIPSGSKALGNSVKYPMETYSMEAYTTSNKVNPTFIEVQFFVSMKVDERFHGSCFQAPCDIQLVSMKVHENSVEVFLIPWQ